jgi:hypothetical protein
LDAVYSVQRFGATGFSNIESSLRGSLLESIVCALPVLPLTNSNYPRMPTPSDIDLLRQSLTESLWHREVSVCIGRERQAYRRSRTALDATNAHSQADEPPLSFVMEFNADENEWREAQTRVKKMLKGIER